MKIEQGLGKTYYERTATPSDPKAGPVSKSLLWEFTVVKSPFKWRHGKPKEVSKAMELGTLIHAATLEPGTFNDVVIVSSYPDFRTKEAREWKVDQIELGKIITTEDEIEKIKDIATVVIDDYHLKFQASYKTEMAVFGKIGETEIKGSIDLVPDGLDCLVDLKTTASIDGEEALQRVIVNKGYHWQAALYLDLWNAASGEKRTRFVFCFVEVEAPHETAWVELSENLLELGRAGYMNALAKWQKCVATNHWPKRIEKIALIEAPKYITQ